MYSFGSMSAVERARTAELLGHEQPHQLEEVVAAEVQRRRRQEHDGLGEPGQSLAQAVGRGAEVAHVVRLVDDHDVEARRGRIESVEVLGPPQQLERARSRAAAPGSVRPRPRRRSRGTPAPSRTSKSRWNRSRISRRHFCVSADGQTTRTWSSGLRAWSSVRMMPASIVLPRPTSSAISRRRVRALEQLEDRLELVREALRPRRDERVEVVGERLRELRERDERPERLGVRKIALAQQFDGVDLGTRCPLTRARGGARCRPASQSRRTPCTAARPRRRRHRSRPPCPNPDARAGRPRRP